MKADKVRLRWPLGGRTDRSLTTYHDGEPVMVTHTVTREQYYGTRSRRRGHGTARARRSAPVRDIMAAAVPAGTSSAADWKKIMEDAHATVYGVGE